MNCSVPRVCSKTPLFSDLQGLALMWSYPPTSCDRPDASSGSNLLDLFDSQFTLNAMLYINANNAIGLHRQTHWQSDAIASHGSLAIWLTALPLEVGKLAPYPGNAWEMGRGQGFKSLPLQR